MNGMQMIHGEPFMTSSGFSTDKIWMTVHVKKGNVKNKMDGYTSIPLAHNKVCDNRRASNNISKNCVCRYCYSYIQATIHPGIRKKMEHNSVQFSNLGYNPERINTVNNCLRYISFGDVSNHVQVINIIRHACKNNHLHKAVWTKMYGFWKQKGIHGEVEQFNLIWSVSKLDCMKFFIPKGFTKSFYVYTNKDTMLDARMKAEKEGWKVIECNKQCSLCNHCYKNSETTIVMELLRVGKGKASKKQ